MWERVQPPNPHAADRVGEEAVGHFLIFSWGTKAEELDGTPELQLRLNPQKVWSRGGGAAEAQPERAESLAEVDPRAAGTEAAGWRSARPVPRNAEIRLDR